MHSQVAMHDKAFVAALAVDCRRSVVALADHRCAVRVCLTCFNAKLFAAPSLPERRPVLQKTKFKDDLLQVKCKHESTIGIRLRHLDLLLIFLCAPFAHGTLLLRDFQALCPHISDDVALHPLH